MEPLFEVQDVFDREQFLKLNAAVQRENKTSALFYTLAVILLIIAVFGIISKEFLTVFLCVVFALLFFMLPKTGINSSLKQLEEKPNIMFGQPCTLRFFEDEMIEFTPYSEMHVPYTMIDRVLETQDGIYFFVTPTQAHCIRKYAFSKGNAADLITFLRGYKSVPHKFV